MKKTIVPLSLTLPFVSGMGASAFALAVTSPWGRPLHSATYYLDFHALLIAICGLGILMAGAALNTLAARIEQLEKKLESLTRKL